MFFCVDFPSTSFATAEELLASLAQTSIEIERASHSKIASPSNPDHSVRAVVNVHVVNSERWLHLWFLAHCRLQCAMNNS